MITGESFMSRRRRGWIVGGAVLLLVVLAGATILVWTSRDQAPAATASVVDDPAPTGWGAITAQLGPDGLPDTATALQAFEFVFGSMPDVTLTPAMQEGDGVPGSGSAAIRWVMARWTDLSVAQQQRVAEVLAQPAAAGTASPDSSASTTSTSPTSGTDPSGSTAPTSTSTSTPSTTATGAAARGAPPLARPVSLGAPPPPPPAPTPDAQVQAALTGMLRDAVKQEATKVGLSIQIDSSQNNPAPSGNYQTVHVNLLLAPSDPMSKKGNYVADAWTWGSNRGQITLNPDLHDAVSRTTGPDDTCDVYLPVHSWKDLAATGNSLTGSAIGEILFHEGFHCIQGFMIGKDDATAMDGAPSWIIEGSAAWVGAELAQFNVYSSWWTDWFIHPDWSLMKRDYDAIGFYSALAQSGANLWTLFPSVFKSPTGADPPKSDGAFTTFTSDTPNLPTVWSPTYFRHPDWGSDWEPKGVGVSDDHPPVPSITPKAGATTFDAPEYAVAQRQVLAPSKPKVVVVTSTTPVRVRDDGTIDQVEFTRGAFCFSDDQCKPCPKDDQQDNNARKATAPLDIAATGMVTGAHVTVVMVDHDKHCKDKKKDNWGRPPGPPGGGGGGAPPEGEQPSQPCLIGCPEMNGDPHLVTVDHFRYDFQAAGEFEALAAGDDFGVQARLEMYKDSSSISVVTAAALSVMGDHVGVYLVSGQPEVHINGTTTKIDGTATLPHGGSVTLDTATGSVAVTWPDGSTVWAIPSRAGAAYGLHLVTRLAAGRVGQATGLLGPAPDGRLTARDGTKITYATPKAGSQAYTDLFRAFGDSWRLSTAESQFDYTDKPHDAFDLRQYPDAATSLDQLSADDRARGTAACAHVRDPDRRDQCIFDVGITGDAGLAEGYDVIEAVTNPAGVLAVGSTSPTRTIAPETVDRYRLQITEPGTIYLRHGAITDYSGVISVKVTDPTGLDLPTVPLGEDFGPLKVTPGVYTVSVEAPKDATATYGFSVLAVPPDQKFSISIGDTVGAGTGPGSGNIESWGAIDAYEFSARVGDQIAIVGTDCTDATRILRWTLYLGPDEQTEGGLACNSSPSAIDITKDGTYRLEVTAAATGIYYSDSDLPNGVAYDGHYGFELRRN
jgi:hypothetical protein